MPTFKRCVTYFIQVWLLLILKKTQTNRKTNKIQKRLKAERFKRGVNNSLTILMSVTSGAFTDATHRPYTHKPCHWNLSRVRISPQMWNVVKSIFFLLRFVNYWDGFHFLLRPLRGETCLGFMKKIYFLYYCCFLFAANHWFFFSFFFSSGGVVAALVTYVLTWIDHRKTPFA